MNKEIYEKNLKLVIWETILTSIGVGFSVANMTVFWNSIGLNQQDIGFVQMIYTITICLFDIPMGYIADHFNRRILNIIGDIGVFISCLFNTFSNNIAMVIIAECLMGIFSAMTNGVDQSFIKYNSDAIDKSGNLFKKVNAKLHTSKYVALLIVMIIGGFIARYNVRLTIFLSAIPYLIGGFIAIKIKDFNTKKVENNRDIFKDMITSVKEIIVEQRVRIILISYILGKEITSLHRWIFTPLLLMTGVPIHIVSVAWVLSQLMQIIGGKISEKMIFFKISQKFAIPIILQILWMTVLILKTNIFTIWLFAINGLVKGLVEGNLITPLQEAASDEKQASIMSIASTVEKILYVPLVYFVNYLGNIKLQLALLGICIIFIPVCLINYLQVKKLEKGTESL